MLVALEVQSARLKPSGWKAWRSVQSRWVNSTSISPAMDGFLSIYPVKRGRGSLGMKMSLNDTTSTFLVRVNYMIP